MEELEENIWRAAYDLKEYSFKLKRGDVCLTTG
jgi:hypothetical protein